MRSSNPYKVDTYGILNLSYILSYILKMGHYICEQARAFSLDGFAKHHRVKMKSSAVTVFCDSGIYREE